MFIRFLAIFVLVFSSFFFESTDSLYAACVEGPTGGSYNFSDCGTIDDPYILGSPNSNTLWENYTTIISFNDNSNVRFYRHKFANPNGNVVNFNIFDNSKLDLELENTDIKVNLNFRGGGGNKL